jgi:hypothetical protein
MLKYALLFSVIGLSACAPYVNAGNKNMVTVYVPNTWVEAEALAVADEHCGRYGKVANLRKPRSSDQFGELYDYTCVK